MFLKMIKHLINAIQQTSKESKSKAIIVSFIKNKIILVIMRTITCKIKLVYSGGLGI